MNYSYWEIKTWLSNIDFIVVGSGIVGLNCALHLKAKKPKAKILILEKGVLPQGASTKNAGFACFGSLSEILEDLKNSSENEVFELIKKRVTGLDLLRKNLGDSTIGYKQHGGYEFCLKENEQDLEELLNKIPIINDMLRELFGSDVYRRTPNTFGFNNIAPNLIYNPFEGQLNTGQMMEALLQKAYNADIKILNSVTVEEISDSGSSVDVKTNLFNLKCKKMFIATNGFANKLLKIDAIPARAQVLITKPIKDLKIKGTFHINKGYYYFRNIDDRILFGGGRELDFKTETTTEFGLTEKVQTKLEELLRHVILPNIKFEIDYRWSGIMGIGADKNPIVKSLSENVNCGVKLGGMGVAIGSLVGVELAELI